MSSNYSVNKQKRSTNNVGLQKGSTSVRNTSSKKEYNIGNKLNGGATQKTDYTKINTAKISPLEKLCQKNGTTLNAVLKEISGSYGLKRVNANTINLAQKCANEAYNDLSNKNKNISLKQVKELAKKYYQAVKSGVWTLEGFKKAQNKNKDSLTDRLEKIRKDRNLKNASDEELCRILFEDLFKVKKNLGGLKQRLRYLKHGNFKAGLTSDKELEKALAKEQLQTFTHILSNCSEKERKIIHKVLNYMKESNYVAAEALAIMSGNSQKEQENIAVNAKSVTRERAKNGTLSKKTTTEATIVATKHLGKEAAMNTNNDDIEAAEQFCKNNNINLEKLRTRYAKNPNGKYTEKEKAALALLGILSGDVIGVANSNVMQAKEIKEVLTSFHTKVQEAHLETPVYKEVEDYVSKNPKSTSATKEEFQKLMDETTNNEYSNIVNNKKDITTVKESVSFAKDNTTNPTKISKDGVRNKDEIRGLAKTEKNAKNNNDIKVPVYKFEEKKDTKNKDLNNDNTQNTEKNVFLNTLITKSFQIKTLDDIKIYKKGNGLEATIMALLKPNAGVFAKNQGIEMVKRMSTSIGQLFNILQNLEFDIFSSVVTSLDDNTIIKLSGMTFACMDKNQKLDELSDDIDKRNKLYTNPRILSCA